MAEADRPRATTDVVLVHGLGHDHRQFERVINVLDDWRVIAPDVHRPSTHIVDHQLQALVAQVDDVLGRASPAPVTGGVSMGGAITLVHTLERPRPLAGLVQIAPAVGPGGLSDTARRYVDWLASVVGRGGFAALRTSVLGADLPAGQRAGQLAAIDGWERRYAPEVLVAAWQGFAGSVQPISRAELAGIDLPVLVVGWEHDPLHPLETAEWYATSAPRAELVVIDPPVDDRIPEEVGASLARFLRRYAPAG